jgi:hypothetical protein
MRGDPQNPIGNLDVAQADTVARRNEMALARRLWFHESGLCYDPA